MCYFTTARVTSHAVPVTLHLLPPVQHLLMELALFSRSFQVLTAVLADLQLLRGEGVKVVWAVRGVREGGQG